MGAPITNQAKEVGGTLSLILEALRNAGKALQVALLNLRLDLSATGLSLSGTLTNSGTQVIIAAGAFKKQAILQNNHATASIYLAYGRLPTTADFVLIPGSALNVNFSAVNALYGLSSASSGTFTLIGA